MSDRALRGTGARRGRAVLLALALGVSGAAWAGCGSDDSADSSSEAQERIEQGVEEARQGVERGADEAQQGIEKGTEEAQKGIEEGKEEIEKGAEEAQKGIEKAEEYADRYAP